MSSFISKLAAHVDSIATWSEPHGQVFSHKSVCLIIIIIITVVIAISYWEWGGLVDSWLREWVTLSRPVKLHWHLTYQGYKTLRLWEYNSSLLWPAWCRGRGLFRVWREPLCKYYLLCTHTMAEMEDAAVLGRRSRAWSDQPCVCRWSKGIQTIQSTWN